MFSAPYELDMTNSDIENPVCAKRRCREIENSGGLEKFSFRKRDSFRLQLQVRGQW